MKTRSAERNTSLLLKLIGLFSSVRGYNILVLVVAQYLTCIYVLADPSPDYSVLWDPKLLVLILSCSLTIAAGYIINNLYDSEKDWINRPFRSRIEASVSQGFKLRFYLLLNVTAVLISAWVSIRSMFFFAGYAVALWIYSHLLKRITFVGNIALAALTVVPFFAILFYTKNFSHWLILPALYLFLIILIKDIVKDLRYCKGDVVFSYPTLPAVIGEKKTKILICCLTLLTLIPLLFLCIREKDTGMYPYYLFALIALPLSLVFLHFARTPQTYAAMHYLYRAIIVLGVLFLALR